MLRNNARTSGPLQVAIQPPRRVLFADVSDVPDGAGAVVGDEQAAVFGDGDAYWAAPDLAVFGDETGEEVFVAAVGVAVVHGDANDFVAGAVGAVPGAVFGGKGVAVILAWETRRLGG